MYKEYQPCALLSPYIDKYWEFKGNPEYGMRINILPDVQTLSSPLGKQHKR